MPIRAIYLFVFLSFITLLIQMYSDNKKQKVDQRRNYFMQGVVLALLLNNYYNMLIYLLVVIVVLILNSKMNIGAGDKQILQWLTPAFILLGHVFFSVFFYVAFGIMWFLYYKAFTRLGFKKAIGTPVIVAAWGFTLLFYLLGSDLWISFFT